MPPIDAPWVLVDAAKYNAQHKKQIVHNPEFAQLPYVERTCDFIDHIAAELAKLKVFVYFAWFPTDNPAEISGGFTPTKDRWVIDEANTYWDAVTAALRSQQPHLTVSTLCAATDLLEKGGGMNWRLSDADGSHFPWVGPANQNRPYMIWLETAGGPLDSSLLCDPTTLKHRWVLNTTFPRQIITRGEGNDVLSRTWKAFVLGGAIAYQASIALR